MIARLMKTFNGFMPRQKPIRFHHELLVIHLHGEWCAQVDKISVPDIGEQCIRKSIRVLFPKCIKFCFPEKINEVRQCRRWLYPMVVPLEMIDMKKFYVLQGYTLH